MPTLEWIGKDNVVNHHLEVPYRVLEEQYTYNADRSENMIIRGDNLEALKALLPRYEGKVKCIYIDPPYNTGNEGWVYNDNVNDPRIKKWLGEVVGREGEDLSRHDKWLCMMYPRLKLLQRLLAEDGIIFISIDDTEAAFLRLLCDEIFGTGNFLASIAWEKRYTRSNNAKLFYSLKDTIFCYRKSDTLSILKEARSEKADSNYSNPDNDPRGEWMTASYVNPATKEKRPNLVYQIISPDGRTIEHPTHAWKYQYSEHQRHVRENRLWWGNDGSAIYPRLKLYKSEMSGMVPVDLWNYKETGTTDEGGNTLKAIFGDMVFDTPKPTKLIERMLKMVDDTSAIVLDSFAGSGTTAHAVLNMNKADGGRRKFILVEMMDYAESITAERVKRVIDGYGQGKNAVAGTGGDFTFYDLGPVLLLPNGNLNEDVGAEKIREYVYFMETKQTLEPEKADEPYYMGVYLDSAYYFYYQRESLTTLNRDFLRDIKTKAGRYTIYADLCTLSPAELERWHITFKKIPRDISKL